MKFIVFTLSILSLHWSDFALCEPNNVLGLGFAYNEPTGKSEEKYTNSMGYPYLSLRFYLSEELRVGVYHEFKNFQKISNASQINLRVFGEEIDYLTRFYHPVYGVIGSKIFLVHSLEKPIFFSPSVIEGEDAYRSFGAALTFGILYKLNPNWDVNLHFDRWLLIGPTKLYGWDCVLDFGYRFSFP